MRRIISSFVFGSLLFYLKSFSMALKSTGYNPIFCLSILDSLFPMNESSCSKLTNLVECAGQYFPMLSDNDFNKGLKNLKSEICSDSYLRDSASEDKCASNHKYSLYSCTFHYINSEAEDADVDPKLLKCWKKYNSNFCNHHISSCPHQTSEIFNTLLEIFLSGMYEDSCDHFVYDELTNVKLAAIAEVYSELALCIDRKLHLVTKCIPKKWTSANLSMDIISQKDLCRTVDSVLDCIGNIVQTNCPNSKNKFINIVQILQIHIMPNCSRGNEILVTTSQHDESLQKMTGKFSKNFATQSELTTIKSTEKVSSNTLELPTEAFTEKVLDKKINSSQPNIKISENFVKSILSRKITDNVPAIPTNTSVLSNNSTNPIVIEKHVFITVAYRPKSAANSIYTNPVFILILICICLIKL